MALERHWHEDCQSFLSQICQFLTAYPRRSDLRFSSKKPSVPNQLNLQKYETQQCVSYCFVVSLRNNVVDRQAPRRMRSKEMPSTRNTFRILYLPVISRVRLKAHNCGTFWKTERWKCSLLFEKQSKLFLIVPTIV